jgi:orotate phosphoribosyltransferase
MDLVGSVEASLEESALIKPGASGIVTEELVNFAHSTSQSIVVLRDLGFNVENAATLLFYGNPKAVETLKSHKIHMTSLFTLHDLLFIAEEHETHPREAIQKYREFLKDPIKWNRDRGYEQVKEGGTQ